MRLAHAMAPCIFIYFFRLLPRGRCAMCFDFPTAMKEAHPSSVIFFSTDTKEHSTEEDTTGTEYRHEPDTINSGLIWNE